MKIYLVTAYDSAYCWYFCATKKEAIALRRTLRENYAESDYPDAQIEIEPMEIAPTRKGVADALQDFVDMTCVNEH